MKFKVKKENQLLCPLLYKNQDIANQTLTCKYANICNVKIDCRIFLFE